MKKFINLIFIIIICFEAKTQIMNIPYGTTPTIDGIISTAEWDDAAYTSIKVNSNWDVDVYYKHGDSNFYFAFINLKTVFGERYPDIFFDINHDKNISWLADDWWFHASYNDCEGKGKYNNWTSCIPSHPGWKANNFPLSEPGIIEIEINYSKIGLANYFDDTIGIALEVSNTFDDYKYYPVTARIESPSTWTEGVISYPSNTEEINLEKSELKLFPNPSNSSLTIRFPNPDYKTYSLFIYDLSGHLIQIIENIQSNQVTVYFKNQTKGLYFIKLQNSNGIIRNAKFFSD